MGVQQGQAYALGATMFSVVEKYLELESTRLVPRNILEFLAIYSGAAYIANQNGRGCFVFDEKLVDQIARYRLAEN